MSILDSDNQFPKLLLTNSGDGATPAAGLAKLYVNGSKILHYKDDTGTDIALGAGFANPMTTAGDIIYGGASGVATRLAGGTSTYVLTSNGATSAPSWQAAAGGGALTYATNTLGADVTLTTANTYYDGPAVTLSAGTWLLVGQVTLNGNVGTALNGTAKLWDGTTVAASGEAMLYAGYAGCTSTIPLSAVVVIASGTPTWKISAAAPGGTSPKIKAAATENAAGNTASVLTAVKIV